MSTLYWSLREAASWLKNMWHWPELGTVPPPDVHFCRSGSGNEENIEESWVILVTLHIVLTRTWRITTWVRSTECVGLYQRLWLSESTWCSIRQEMKPTVLKKFDKQGNLCETHFRKQCLSLIGGIKEFEIMVAEFVSAVSSSTQQTSSLIRLSITITKTPFSPDIMLWHWKSIFWVPF